MAKDWPVLCTSYCSYILYSLVKSHLNIRFVTATSESLDVVAILVMLVVVVVGVVASSVVVVVISVVVVGLFISYILHEDIKERIREIISKVKRRTALVCPK